MVVETAAATIATAAATEIAAEVAAEVATEAVAEASISVSGATELSEALSAIEKEVPREVIDQNVETVLQDPAFRDELRQQLTDIHSISDVPFVEKEVTINGESIIKDFPDFSEYSPFETQLPEELYQKSDYQHFKYCNEQLREGLENGRVNPEQFTERQREQIANGDKPEGYTWHHHEDKGRMQLVDSEVHDRVPHTGGRAIWGGGREAR